MPIIFLKLFAASAILVDGGPLALYCLSCRPKARLLGGHLKCGPKARLRGAALPRRKKARRAFFKLVLYIKMVGLSL